MGKSTDSIAATINRASEFPDDIGVGANLDIPQLFVNYPVPGGEPIVDNVSASKTKVQGVPKYNFLAHYKRFIMGSVEVGFDQDGHAMYESQDDTKEYEQLMNEMLSGDAIIRNEERSILRNGTVIISISYFTPKPKK